MPIDVFFEGGKKVSARIDNFIIKTDQPLRAGGEESAPQPFTLFLASLATCAGIYVKGFCDQRGIEAEGITLTLAHFVDPATHLVAKFVIDIHVPADFPEKYDQAVINAASVCAVKRHLSKDIQNEINVVRATN
jgi:putative redox protein